MLIKLLIEDEIYIFLLGVKKRNVNINKKNNINTPLEPVKYKPKDVHIIKIIIFENIFFI